MNPITQAVEALENLVSVWDGDFTQARAALAALREYEVVEGFVDPATMHEHAIVTPEPWDSDERPALLLVAKEDV
jgi:hypothetical protein